MSCDFGVVTPGYALPSCGFDLISEGGAESGLKTGRFTPRMIIFTKIAGCVENVVLVCEINSGRFSVDPPDTPLRHAVLIPYPGGV